MTDRSGAAGRSRQTKGRSGRARQITRVLLRWLAIFFLVAWIVIPFLVTISASLKTRGAVFADPSIIPSEPTLASYREVLARPSFRSAFLNSVILGIGTTALTLLLAVPAAYAFARFNFRLRHVLLLFVLLPRLVPGVALLLPLYRLAAELGVLNNLGTLIVVYSGGLLPLAIWLLMGFFQQIPNEIEEAATVDGAGLLQRQRHIVLPMAIPALITVGVLAFREAWNEFQLPLVLATTQEARPLPFELYSLQGLNLANLPQEAAFALLTILPLAVVYIQLERYVVQGVVSGSSR